MEAEIKKREVLFKRKLKSFYDLEEDGSNLDKILSEYEKIAEFSKHLLTLEGKTLQYAAAQQPKDFTFYLECKSNLKSILDYYEAQLKYLHAQLHRKIRENDPKDMTEKEINSKITCHDSYRDLLYEVLKIKDIHERYSGIIEAYRTRGYSLNNITKGLEIEASNIIL
jgi:hypothetical protein